SDKQSRLRLRAASAQGRKRLVFSPEVFSGRGPLAAESAENLVQVFGDANLVVEEILQPKVIVALGEGDQRQEVAPADAHRGFGAVNVGGLGGRGINAKMRSHSQTSL